MFQGEHSVILSTFIKLPFVIKIFFVYFGVAVLHRFYCIFQDCDNIQDHVVQIDAKAYVPVEGEDLIPTGINYSRHC